MRIGELAKECGCPIETIRYYEKIGLLPPAVRRANGYRSYDDGHRNWLNFIIRSRALGFSQEEVRQLTDVAHQKRPACAEVYDMLDVRSKDVESRIRELKQMQKALDRLKASCHDGTLHDCPVIDELMNR